MAMVRRPRAADDVTIVGARPLIAVTTSELRRPETEPVPQGEPPRLELALGTLYPQAIERAGGIPVIIPPLRPNTVGPLLDTVDGVCIPGGPDLQPRCYGQAPHPELGPTEPRIDALELAVVTEADARGLPLLGICRGMQVINVARGGTLHQHLPDAVGEVIRHRQQVHGSIPTHGLTTAPNSRVRALLGPGTLGVNSFHHQGVDELGQDLVVTAWAPDGTIEAIEEPGPRIVLGVQWHAEGLRAHAPLFECLVAASSGASALAQAG
ncbi:MAG TPA: gamma-glutamyl-gamma-aminobutyrate hydrolase family protein [Solirubrobacteraceae bacterium]|jgi:putative glutamine amidotransferase